MKKKLALHLLAIQFFYGALFLGCIDPDFVGQQRITAIGGGDYQGFSYQLIRLETNFAIDGQTQTTYIQYFPDPDTSDETKSMLLYTVPYEGIAWSGESIDFSAPAQMTPIQAGQEALPYLTNGVGVTFIYGRFFTSEDSENDVRDVRAGYRFLRRENYKGTHTGTHGASWGGYMALFGAAYSDLNPSVGSVSFPPSDLKEWNQFISDHPRPDTFGQHIEKMTLRFGDLDSSDFSGFRREDLIKRLNGRFQIFHDEWDTLVPVAMSRQLVAESTNFTGVYITHEEPVDLAQMQIEHFPGPQTWRGPATIQLTWLHLLLALSDRAQIKLYVDADSLLQFFLHTRQEQLRGVDVSWLVSVLLEMADSRVVYVDGANGSEVSGREWVASVLSSYWGIFLAPDKVEDYLLTNGIE